MTTTLVALTWNEIDGVKAILPQIDRSWFDQILVIDGGSRDGTIEWCREHGFEVYVQKKPGVRYAYMEGLALYRGDVILSISPDGNCPVDRIPEILAKMREGYDMVIGSRYLGEYRSDDDTFLTGLANWLCTRTVNLLYGAHYTDVMVIYRAFRRGLIYELDLDKEESYRVTEKLFSTVLSWEPLMSVRAAKAKKRIAEVGVGEPPRIAGKRKVSMWRWGFAFYFQFFYELWNWRRPRPAEPEDHSNSTSRT